MLVREAAQLMLAADPSIHIFAPVLDNEEWLQRVTSGDYKDYYEKMYG